MTVLGLPFSEKLHVFGPDFTARAVGSPTGKVPLLQDGKRMVWDSLAIAEYLADRHGGVWPTDADARAWARSAAAEMHSSFQALRNACSMNCGIRVSLHDPEAVRSDVERLVQLWSDGLQRFGGPFLAGSAFGAVDAFFCPVAFRVQSYGLELPSAAAAYVERLLALPAMRAWYAAALAEPYRDPPHEAEIPGWGAILKDLRQPARDTAAA